VRRGLPYDLVFAEHEAALKTAFCTLLALVLRFAWYDAQPLWTDEVITWEFARADWPGLLWRQLYDASPPGFYLLLKAWLRVATATAELRWLPALCGAAAVPLTYALGRAAHSRAAGVLGALLVAVNPLHLYYSNEVRYPTLLTLLVLAQALLLLHALRDGRARWFAGFALATAAALWVQYTAGFFLLVEGAYVLWRYRRERRMIFRFALATAAALLLFAPWWTEFSLQWARGKPSREFFGFFESLFLGPAFLLLGGSEWSLPTLCGVAPERSLYLVVATALLLPFLLAAFLGARREAHNDPPRLLTCLALGPFVILLLLGLGLPIFRPKYLLPLLPFAAVLAAMGLVELEAKRRAAGWIVLALTLAVSLGGVARWQHDPRLAKEPWDKVVETIATHWQPGDGVAVPNDYYSIALAHAAHYRWPLQAAVRSGPNETLLDPAQASDNARRLLTHFARVWYVDHDAHLFDPRGHLPEALAAEGVEVTRRSFLRSPHFSVRLYARDAVTARRSLAGVIDFTNDDFAPAQLVDGVTPGPPGMAWMGAAATVEAARRWNEDLAFACFYVHRPYFGTDDPRFTLRADDFTVASRTVPQSDLLCLEGVLPATATGETVRLTLAVDRPFIPDEVLGDGDRTPKSALLQKIGLTRTTYYWERP